MIVIENVTIQDTETGFKIGNNPTSYGYNLGFVKDGYCIGVADLPSGVSSPSLRFVLSKLTLLDSEGTDITPSTGDEGVALVLQGIVKGKSGPNIASATGAVKYESTVLFQQITPTENTEYDTGIIAADLGPDVMLVFGVVVDVGAPEGPEVLFNRVLISALPQGYGPITGTPYLDSVGRVASKMWVGPTGKVRIKYERAADPGETVPVMFVEQEKIVIM